MNTFLSCSTKHHTLEQNKQTSVVDDKTQTGGANTANNKMLSGREKNPNVHRLWWWMSGDLFSPQMGKKQQKESSNTKFQCDFCLIISSSSAFFFYWPKTNSPSRWVNFICVLSDHCFRQKSRSVTSKRLPYRRSKGSSIVNATAKLTYQWGKNPDRKRCSLWDGCNAQSSDRTGMQTGAQIDSIQLSPAASQEHYPRHWRDREGGKKNVM